MKLGFAKSDITPRVGVELSGFGPYRCRHSTAVRDRLWARAMAVEQGGQRALIVSCDIIGTTPAITLRLRQIVTAATGIPADAIMLHSTHSHSGPATAHYIGWGEPDPPYLETLPQRIAKACLQAAANLQTATLAHAETPCEGIGQNREYDRNALPLEEVLPDHWRPLKPELTDTTCHVLRASTPEGKMIGFVSYFGCHPVVCCEATSHIHGDFCGVATNMLERENPGTIGLFLQGAQGDVNPCVVHKPEPESLLALDIIAARYANAVRNGLRQATPMQIDALRHVSRSVVFTRKPWGLEKLRELLAEKEAFLRQSEADDNFVKDNVHLRMETVYAVALRKMIAAAEAGQSLSPATELQGIRLGPVALLGTPFEVFQAIKNDVKAAARSRLPLVMGFTNESVGYAPDRTAAARGGYAADIVPLIGGQLPYARIHDELLAALLELDKALQ